MFMKFNISSDFVLKAIEVISKTGNIFTMVRQGTRFQPIQ